MKAALIFQWPEMPVLPQPEQPVLIRVATTTQSRSAARQELRAVLRATLAAWSKLLPEQLPLRETAAGPVWPESFGGQALDISLSYAGAEGWIGLLRGGWIGVDVMQIQRVAEAEAVAQNFLEADELETIQQSTDPALAFATAWTSLEARLKCFKQPLRESSASTGGRLGKKHATENLLQPNHFMVTVATAARLPG
jgi:phosphopantetheinyl transferase